MTTTRLPRLSVLAPLLLAACQAGVGTAPTDRTGAPSEAVERPATTLVRGHATYRERIKMPPGASLRVELLAGGAGARVLASTVVPDVAGPPIAFSLPVPSGALASAADPALRAELRGPDGQLWLSTPAPVALAGGAAAPVQLMLRRATDATTPAADNAIAVPAGRPTHWECGELGVMARGLAGGALRLSANGRDWALAPGPAASGVHHADPAGTAFRSKGASATLTIAGEAPRDCVRARQASPWNDALLRGVAFRAVGNEPGWFVEVDAGDAPALRATLDYGERSLAITPVRTMPAGYSGATAAGEAVTLRIERRPCTDGMSGQAFEATARLQAGERAYTGCGAFLSE